MVLRYRMSFAATRSGMVLVSAPLTRKNYLNWSYAIKRALRAKMKLGFIDGTLTKPDVSDTSFEKWIRVDSMFLMGLGESFDHVQHQLLVMDPVPSVNKAYSMVQRVERQKEVHMEITDTGEHTAIHVRAGIRKDISLRGDQKRRNFVDKRQSYYEHCAKSGHTKDTCFKIHGTPDWYKDLVEQRRKDVNGTGSGRNFTANNEERKVQSHLNEDSKELLLKELIKLVRGTHPEPVQQVNFAQLDDFAGMNCTLTNLEIMF
ncbi:UNVERIFIED_CONTAM: hypothetical protein Scaly_2440400 [Sesamum calycinum]|uniref:Retrotransposon Copia-like N-terminal domain-containing protein n=1 Tax=Sesamum calycinum TaxID=2727403 RepID=A0AAW2M0W5_9LAMI